MIAIFSLILAFIVAVILVIFIIIEALWILLYLNSIEYFLDKNNLIFKGGVISRFEKILPYSKIQHVIIYESFIQRILGLSSVSIETARERGSTVSYNTGPLIPDLKSKDAVKLKNYLIKISNSKYKPVAGI